MLRAMDSAVAGLRSHQNKMDVVGHNIANVNTFGFKAQTYTFKEAMYQTATVSSAGRQNGGVNAAQYGYGTLMGSIGMDMTASTPSYVGGFNASIDGEGFFITKSTKIEGGVESTGFKNNDFEYTRVGQFLLDNNGYVVDANGNFVYGFRKDFTKDANGDVDPTKFEEKMSALRVPLVEATYKPGTPAKPANPGTPGDPNDPATPAVPATPASIETTAEIKDTDVESDASPSITIQINNSGEITATVKVEYEDDKKVKKSITQVISLGKVAIATFQNPNGVTKSGGNYYTATDTDNTGLAVAAAPGDAGTSTLMGGFIEASNVDLAKEFSDMITTHRGFQANSKMITVSDEMLQDLVAMKR